MSRGRVLRKLRGIHSVRARAQAESEALLEATHHVFDQTDVGQRFTAADIYGMHRLWLDDIHAWAGEYRQVNMVLDRITEIAPPKKGADVPAALEAIRSEFPSATDFEREFPSLCFALAIKEICVTQAAHVFAPCGVTSFA